MLGLKVVCWFWFMWLIGTHIVNTGKCTPNQCEAKFINDLCIIVMIFILYKLHAI